MDAAEALAYLSTIGPHSNVPRIRAALTAVEPGPDAGTWLNRTWADAIAALDGIENRTGGAPEARIRRADARDELLAAVEALLSEMSQPTATEPLTPQSDSLAVGLDAQDWQVKADIFLADAEDALGQLRTDKPADTRRLASLLAEAADLISRRPVTLTRNEARECEQCGKPFTAGRADARYCSGACRVRAHRARQISVVGE
jgi:hypothetical protein